MQNRRIGHFESLEFRRLMAVGDLLSTFGDNGTARESILHDATPDDLIAGMIANPNGGYYIASRSWPGRNVSTVTSFDQNGNLDTSFGDNGVALVSLGSGNDWPTAIALQPDSKIIVAGYIRSSESNATSNLALSRLNIDGSVDQTFGDLGQVAQGLGGHAGPSKVLVRPTGEILIYAEQPDRLRLIQLSPDGSVDTAFADGGELAINVDDVDGCDLLLLEDGSALISASAKVYTGQYEARIYKVTRTGEIDLNFGTNGFQRFNVAENASNNIYDWPLEMVVVDDGGLVVSGVTRTEDSYGLFAAKLLADGQFDAQFGNDGFSTLTADARSGTAVHDLLRTNDGSLVALANVADDSNAGTAVLWMDANGNVSEIVRDSTFVDPKQFGAAIIENGRILFSSTSARTTTSYPDALFDQDLQTLAFDIATRTRDSNFGLNGAITTNVFDKFGNAEALGAVDLPNGDLLVLVEDHFQNANLESTLQLIKYNPSGILDTTYGDLGHLNLGSFVAESSLVDTPYGRFVVAIENFNTRQIHIAKLTTDGSLDSTFADAGWLVYPYSGLEIDDVSFTADAIFFGGHDFFTGYSIGKFDYLGQSDMAFGEQGSLMIPTERFRAGTSVRLAEYDSDSVVGLIANKSQSSSFSVEVLKFSTAGITDNTFGNQGYAATDLRTGLSVDDGRNLKVLSDGSMIVFGTNSGGQVVLQKLQPTGEIDRDFGQGGLANLGVVGTQVASDFTLDSQGRIIALASLPQAYTTTTLVSRFDESGTLDMAFAGDGIAEFVFGDYGGVNNKVTVVSFDDIVITGYELGSVDQHTITSRIIGSLTDNPSWHNAQLNEDTNNDGMVSALDVLLVINYLNSHPTANLPNARPRGEAYVDVTNDGIVSAADTLQIINYLNSNVGNAEGESGTNGHDAMGFVPLLLMPQVKRQAEYYWADIFFSISY